MEWNIYSTRRNGEKDREIVVYCTVRYPINRTDDLLFMFTCSFEVLYSQRRRATVRETTAACCSFPISSARLSAVFKVIDLQNRGNACGYVLYVNTGKNNAARWLFIASRAKRLQEIVIKTKKPPISSPVFARLVHNRERSFEEISYSMFEHKNFNTRED